MVSLFDTVNVGMAIKVFGHINKLTDCLNITSEDIKALQELPDSGSPESRKKRDRLALQCLLSYCIDLADKEMFRQLYLELLKENELFALLILEKAKLEKAKDEANFEMINRQEQIVTKIFYLIKEKIAREIEQAMVMREEIRRVLKAEVIRAKEDYARVLEDKLFSPGVLKDGWYEIKAGEHALRLDPYKLHDIYEESHNLLIDAHEQGEDPDIDVLKEVRRKAVYKIMDAAAARDGVALTSEGKEGGFQVIEGNLKVNEHVIKDSKVARVKKVEMELTSHIDDRIKQHAGMVMVEDSNEKSANEFASKFKQIKEAFNAVERMNTVKTIPENKKNIRKIAYSPVEPFLSTMFKQKDSAVKKDIADQQASADFRGLFRANKKDAGAQKDITDKQVSADFKGLFRPKR